MAREIVLLWWMAACVAAHCAGQGRHGAMLGADSFARSASFIEQTARPIERALFRFHFQGGNRESVLSELAKFQNADGGFASYLESDNRWSGPSPLATMIALRIFHEVGASPEDLRVRSAVRYLLANFDERKGYWHPLPKEANTAPHAPWWEVHQETGKCDVESPVFPTAAIAGYLRPYSDQLPAGFLDRVTKASLDYLSAASVKMQMPDIEMLTDLIRVLPKEQTSRKEAIAKIRSVLAAVIVRDPRQWSNYGIQPLTFLHTPGSPFDPGMETEIGENLDYVIRTQKEDGGWVPNWSWEKVDPVAWRQAEREWRGVLTLENLKRLEAFHRISR